MKEEKTQTQLSSTYVKEFFFLKAAGPKGFIAVLASQQQKKKKKKV